MAVKKLFWFIENFCDIIWYEKQKRSLSQNGQWADGQPLSVGDLARL